MRALFLIAALAVVGCDAVGDDAPAWAEPGAAAAFDYTPGPDSLLALGPGRTPPFRAADAAARAVELRVVASPDWRRTDRHVEWHEPGVGGLSRFAGAVQFPLADADVDVTGDGLRVVVSTGCSGGFLGGARGTLAFVRVPRTTGTIQTFGNCSNGPGATLDASRTETVAVPAGTFEAVVVEDAFLRQREWWSWEAGLVRLDVFGRDGALAGRFERSAP